MHYIIKKELIDFTLGVLTECGDEDVSYAYRGEFSEAITDNMLALAERNIVNSEELAWVKKRVYYIMVECLQNITRHQFSASSEELPPAFFYLNKVRNNFLMTTGNTISNNDVEKLQEHLNTINGCTKEELDKYFKQTLNNESFNERGGAGLGLINIARKSGNKLRFHFEKYTQDHSLFFLNTEIANNVGNLEVQNSSLKSIVTFENILSEFKIKLLLCNYFNQERLKGILTMIENQIYSSSAVKKKLFNILVELLQNIVFHADNPNGSETDNPGIILIMEEDARYVIVTGNFIQKNKVESFKTKLDRVNSVEVENLPEFYNDKLLDSITSNNSRAGVGIIDIRLKSSSNFSYTFTNYNEGYSHFLLTIDVDKN